MITKGPLVEARLRAASTIIKNVLARAPPALADPKP